MIRVYGKLELAEGLWRLTGEPHAITTLKRIFGRIDKGEHGTVTMKDTDEVRKKIRWYLSEYPMEVSPEHRKAIDDGASRHQEMIYRLDDLIGQNVARRKYAMALPPREYQKIAAEMVLERKGLLIADELGLGKTIEGLAILTEPDTLPAIIVTMSGTMPEQWRNQTWRFLPDLQTHIVKTMKPYPLPRMKGQTPDVVIITYHKLSGWAETLAPYGRSIIFDEVQELRRRGSLKYKAAEFISKAMKYRAGLSATPIFNMGGEIWNIVNVLMPDCLGTWEEFVREWCHGENPNDKKAPAVADPKALGSYLQREHLMLRRTRSDVGQEMPEVTKIIQAVESDEKIFNQLEGKAIELAKIILSNSAKVDSFKRMRAEQEFDNRMRQATGIAKAPYVAEFIRLLVEGSGESIVVFAWHRGVYDILLEKLKDLKPAMFTGSETVAEKQASLDLFKKGETKVLLMSLRAGQGVDGLQHVCRTVVIAELDWTDAVMEQDIGRVHRDGQKDPVTAYFLVSDSGSDPTISETIGLKKSQLMGIRDPNRPDVLEVKTDRGKIKDLARLYLEKKGVEVKADPKQKVTSEA